ncbi:MATE family efflux transporter [uncultured Mailhella sp.]|uniref:MATE family efflux transporter n=1 Tax=uncultured Mailhella sp. TaxID=1981031 RepID=UPI00261FE9AA|nr:MATE family efflux transporter [uncultured Mailhella sp.]
MNTAHTNVLETERIPRLLFSYSIPAIVGMIIVAFNQIISGIYIGYGVGHLGLAAMAVTFPVINLIMAFCQLVAVGCAALCSIELGRKDYEKAGSMLGHSVLLEAITSIGVGFLFWVFLDPMLLFFGASADTLELARDFMLPLLIFAPLSFLMLGFNFFARATGYPKTAMGTAIFSSLGIVIFTPVFIFWLGWGMAGAGLAQIAGQAMSIIWLVWHFFRKTTLIHFQKGIWKLRLRSVKRIVSVGMAPFLINFCACIVVVVINRELLLYGGDISVGAYGIVNRLVMLFGLSVVGLGQGMQPIIGYNFGANRPDRVRLTLRYGLMAGTAVTLLGMLGALLVPGLFVRMFTDYGPLVEASEHALRLSGMLFVFVGPQIIIGTYFQSVGQAKIASLISMLRQMLFLVPALIVLPLFLGLDGVWISLPLADFLGFLVASLILFGSLRAEDNPCGKTDFTCKPPSDFFKPRHF